MSTVAAGSRLENEHRRNITTIVNIVPAIKNIAVAFIEAEDMSFPIRRLRELPFDGIGGSGGWGSITSNECMPLASEEWRPEVSYDDSVFGGTWLFLKRHRC